MYTEPASAERTLLRTEDDEPLGGRECLLRAGVHYVSVAGSR